VPPARIPGDAALSASSFPSLVSFPPSPLIGALHKQVKISQEVWAHNFPRGQFPAFSLLSITQLFPLGAQFPFRSGLPVSQLVCCWMDP